MVTWMTHPNHGKHPATGDEIDRLKSNGWSVCPPKADAESPSVPVVEPVVKIHPQDEKRRPGRPPKNK